MCLEMYKDDEEETKKGKSKSLKKISPKRHNSQSPNRPMPILDKTSFQNQVSGGRPVHVRNLGFTSNSKPGIPQKESQKVVTSLPRNVPNILKRSVSTGFDVNKLTPLSHNPFLVKKDMSLINDPLTFNLNYNPQIPPASQEHPNNAAPAAPSSVTKPFKVIQAPTNTAPSLAPKNIDTPPKNNPKPTAQTWDESLRAILGSAEKAPIQKKNMRKKSKRMSPKKLQQESEDDEEVELGSELNLQDTEITPEAQQILDTFANKLLEKIEEKVEENVVHIQPKPAFENKKLFGPTNPTTKGRHAKDCICCKVESIVRSRKSASPPPPAVPFAFSKEKTDTEMKSQIIPEKAHEEKTETESKSQVTPEKAPEGNTKTSSSLPSSKSPDFVFKTPIKTVAGLLTTPSKTPTRLETITSLEDRAKLLSPTTPTRHIPASPVAGLFSPLSSRSPLFSRRARHQSSINTPTHDLTQDKALNSPVTPNSKASPAPYYTPSPQRPSYSVPAPKSPNLTPGLRFLQEEGERLSQSDDSCSSSSPSPGKSRITGAQKRKTFRNLFKKTTTEAAGKELGSMLEQKILNYPFSKNDDKAAVEKTPSPVKAPFSDYTSSPTIILGLKSGDPWLAGDNSISRKSFYESPNRASYLSPSGVAMSTSLGLNSMTFPSIPFEIDRDVDADNEAEDEDLNPEKEAIDVEKNKKSSQADSVLSKSLMAETDNDDSNVLLTSDAKKNSPSSVNSLRVKSPVSVVEEEAKPRPRRIPLTLLSSKRESPLKNDSTKFEQQFDANNLDKNRSCNDSSLFDDNTNSLVNDDEEKTVTSSQAERRRSPRKHKRKASTSPSYISKRKKNVLSSSDSENNKKEKESDKKPDKDGAKKDAKIEISGAIEKETRNARNVITKDYEKSKPKKKKESENKIDKDDKIVTSKLEKTETTNSKDEDFERSKKQKKEPDNKPIKDGVRREDKVETSRAKRKEIPNAASEVKEKDCEKSKKQKSDGVKSDDKIDTPKSKEKEGNNAKNEEKAKDSEKSKKQKESDNKVDKKDEKIVTPMSKEKETTNANDKANEAEAKKEEEEQELNNENTRTLSKSDFFVFENSWPYGEFSDDE